MAPCSMPAAHEAPSRLRRPDRAAGAHLHLDRRRRGPALTSRRGSARIDDVCDAAARRSIAAVRERRACSPPPAAAARRPPTQQITAALTPDAPVDRVHQRRHARLSRPAARRERKGALHDPRPAAPIVDRRHGSRRAVLTNTEATDISPDFAAPDEAGHLRPRRQARSGHAPDQRLQRHHARPLLRKAAAARSASTTSATGRSRAAASRRRRAYANPTGFIEVTPRERRHLRLRALPSARFPDQGPAERLAEVPAAQSEAARQAGADDRSELEADGPSASAHARS